MRIPVSQGSVSLNPLNTPMVHSDYVEKPSVMGAVAGTLEKIQRAKEEGDNLRAEEALNQVRANQMTLRNDMSLQQGANVLPKEGKSFTDSYLEKFDDGLKQVESTLGNRRQQELLRQRANLLRQNFTADLNAHESREMLNHANEIDSNTLTLESDNAKGNVGNTKELILGQVRIENSMDALASRNGWSDEKKAIEKTKTMTQFHGGVIGAALDQKNTAWAKEYFAKHSSEMDPDARVKVESFIKKQEINVGVDDRANEIWATKGPKSDTAPVNLDALMEEVRKEKDPDIRKVLEAEIKDRAHTHDYSVKQREDATVSDFYKGIEKGGSWAAIKNDPRFESLDGKAQASLRDHYEQERGITKGDGVPAGAPQLYWTMLEKPSQLKAMSVDQIIALTPQLGKRYRDDILQRRDSLMREGGKKGGVTQDVLNDSIKHFGFLGGYLKDKNGKAVQTDPEAWAEINYKINQRIADEGAKTEAEVSNIVRSTMAKVKVEKAGFFGGTKTVDKSLYKMTDQELDSAVVRIDPTELETVYAAFLRRGITNPTKRQIVEAHTALKESE